MAEIRRHVVQPKTVLGLEPALLVVFAVITTPLNLLILAVVFHPISIVIIPAHTAVWWYSAYAFNERNPDFGSVISERLNFWGLPLSPITLRRQHRTLWKTKREIYAP